MWNGCYDCRSPTSWSELLNSTGHSTTGIAWPTLAGLCSRIRFSMGTFSPSPSQLWLVCSFPAVAVKCVDSPAPKHFTGTFLPSVDGKWRPLEHTQQSSLAKLFTVFCLGPLSIRLPLFLHSAQISSSNPLLRHSEASVLSSVWETKVSHPYKTILKTTTFIAGR